RVLGARLLVELKKIATRHAVIGDVRGGHGLFGVVELAAGRGAGPPRARGRGTPAPLTALLRAGMDAGVSLGARGNLLIIAPPLVIGEDALAGAVALLRALTACF